MKIRFLASALPLVLALSAPLASAQDVPPSAPPPGPPPQGHREKSVLEKDMDAINHSTRKLKKQISDSSQNADSLELVARIRAAAESALGQVPPYAKDQPEADQPKFIADYRASMKAFIGDVDNLAAALKAGDNDSAGKLLAQLFQDEHKDHKQFRKPRND